MSSRASGVVTGLGQNTLGIAAAEMRPPGIDVLEPAVVAGDVGRGADGLRGNAHDDGVRGNVVADEGHRADERSLSHLDRREDDGARGDDRKTA